MRRLILIAATVIIVINIVIFLYPQQKQNVEAQVNEHLYSIIDTSIYESPEYALLRELQPAHYNISDQIRAFLHERTSIKLIEIDNSICTIEITAPVYGEFYNSVADDYLIDGDLSLNENRVALLEKLLNDLQTADLQSQTVLLELEIINNGDTCEVELNRDFYNLIYGGLVDVIDTKRLEFISEGDAHE